MLLELGSSHETAQRVQELCVLWAAPREEGAGALMERGEADPCDHGDDQR